MLTRVRDKDESLSTVNMNEDKEEKPMVFPAEQEQATDEAILVIYAAGKKRKFSFSTHRLKY